MILIVIINLNQGFTILYPYEITSTEYEGFSPIINTLYNLYQIFLIYLFKFKNSAPIRERNPCLLALEPTELNDYIKP